MPTSADHHTSAPADYRPERVGPPVIPDYKIIQEDCYDELLASLKRDIAWYIAGSFKGEDLELLGSWTPFNKNVSKSNTVACR